MVNIFSYTDYRKFLSDWFLEKKLHDRHFSHRVFAEQAGFKARTFMPKVLSGEKELSRKSIGRVGRALGLKKKELAYFKHLVLIATEKSLDKKIEYYARLQSVNKSNAAMLLRKDQYEYFRTWYVPALRELAAMIDFGDDFGGLGRMLRPAISARQARQGVELLMRLRLLARKDGRYVQTDAALSTGDLVRSLAVTDFQRQTMDLAKAALTRFTSEREISTLSFGTSEEGFRQLQAEVIAFRKRCIDLIMAHKNPDRVYQLNFQLFPLSQATGGGTRKS